MDIEAWALSDAASNIEYSRIGDGDREGARDEEAEAGVLLPDEKDESDSERKNGEVGRSSGVPSSTAYSSWDMFAPGTQF